MTTHRTQQSVCYYFRFIIALPMGRQTKRKCYRPPKRASWTLELSLPQINLFKVVLKSLKLLMDSRTSLPSPSTPRVTCRWPFRIWNNSTASSVPRDPVTWSNKLYQFCCSSSNSSQICEILTERFMLSESPKWPRKSPKKSPKMWVTLLINLPKKLIKRILHRGFPGGHPSKY